MSKSETIPLNPRRQLSHVISCLTEYQTRMSFLEFLLDVSGQSIFTTSMITKAFQFLFKKQKAKIQTEIGERAALHHALYNFSWIEGFGN